MKLSENLCQIKAVLERALWSQHCKSIKKLYQFLYVFSIIPLQVFELQEHEVTIFTSNKKIFKKYKNNHRLVDSTCTLARFC